MELTLLEAEGAGGLSFALISIAAAILFFVIFIYAMYRRLKVVPAGKVLVVYGQQQGGQSGVKFYLDGRAFIWPIIQDYTYLDLTPLNMETKVGSVFSRDNVPLEIRAKFTAAVSTDPNRLKNAADRIIGLDREALKPILEDLFHGRMRLVISTLAEEEIRNEKDKFIDEIERNVDEEFAKVGLELINVNVTDIKIRN